MRFSDSFIDKMVFYSIFIDFNDTTFVVEFRNQMKRAIITIVLSLGFLVMNSQIVNPGSDLISGLTALQVSHLEIKEQGGGLNITTGPATITEVTNSLPTGNYDIEIVYIDNTRKKIEYHTED